MRELKFSLHPITNSWRETLRFIAILKRFSPHLRPQIWPLTLASLASLGFTLTTLLEPWPLQVIFDGVILGEPVSLLGVDLDALSGGNPYALLAGASAAVLLIAALRGQFYYLQNVKAATSGQDVVMAVRRELFAHLQTLSLSFHHHSRSGDLLMRLTGDIVMLREMVVAALITLITQSLVVVGYLIIMAMLNLRLTLVAIIVMPILFIVLSVFRIRLVDAAKRQRKREGRLASTVHEVLGSIKVVQAYTAEKHENDRFKDMNKRSLRAGVRLTRIEAQLNRSVQISLALGICVTLWLGAQDVMSDKLSPGQLLVFLAYLRGLYRPLRQVSKLNQRMAKASACGDRVLEVLDQKPEIEDPPDPVTLRRVRGEIEFRDLSFSYDGSVLVLQGINLKIARRETVALVGPTGAGKSTLISLLPRFYDPQSGQILVDDTPIRSVRVRSLRRQISYLPQETIVMGVSISENIAYGAIGGKKGPAGQEEIEQAARSAHAHEFIVELPGGYETVVGERGSTLSGGQRQRIAIARAFLRNAPILLLDEPITGLDPLSAKLILDALDQLSRKRSTLVVAHHLNTVLRADRIVFLREGKIFEEGTHDSLLAMGGEYAKFFQTEWGSLTAGKRGEY